VNVLGLVDTLKNRLPTPSARLQSSVINQPIVCGPFVNAVQSMMACPPAAAVFAKPGKAPAMSVLASPYTTGCSGPESIEYCTPEGWILHVAAPFTFGVSPQPKFGPEASPPIAGVSIDPNGLVAVLLLIATVFEPIVAVLP